MGPVVMVTSCPPAPPSLATLKQPSEHSNKEWVLLHTEADLLGNVTQRLGVTRRPGWRTQARAGDLQDLGLGLSSS